MNMAAASPLKLNVRRTALIGFAFFGILLLWQVYDSWCPTFLTDIFARNIYDLSSAELKASDPEKLLHVQWIVGIIMACDNLAALILLPLFGKLSDRTRTPIGKRMPYILVGTFVSALAFPFIPLFFHRNNVFGMVAMMAVVLLFMMMYRNPAVALMPDITPKPLRAKANGIINIMGYFGGAFATVLGIFLHIIANSIRIKEFVLTRKINIQKDMDEMTGLKNKGSLTREINEYLADESTDKGILLVMDVDRFKSINDTYGHDVGDSVISQLGGYLRSRFTHDEIIGRFGGDEFILFIRDTDDPDFARRIAEEVIKGTSENVILPDRDRKVSISIGIAVYHGAEKNYSEIFKKADTALYQSKADPDNRCYVYTESEPEP